jgi:hypothetical protein
MSWFLIALALASGVLQIAGYIVYIRKSLKHDLEPNPTTWFMFAYGVLVLTILEWDQGANWTLLILPVSCAILAIVVAGICWKNKTLRWPEHRVDAVAFSTDVLLTMGYIGSWIFLSLNIIDSYQKNLFTLLFLVCSNLTTFTAFVPIIRGVIHDPVQEHSTPWAIWTSAYLTLTLLTYLQFGIYSQLMIYPITNAILHGLVGWLSRLKRKDKLRRALNTALGV